jgi:multicomponent Na+:H+ antiporter subunit G
MIDALLTVLAGVSLLVGAAFALVGALGVIRFPDVYTRMHAASKAGTLGSGFCLIAVALAGNSVDVTTRAIAAVLFFVLTAPISAHLLARAGLIAGYRGVGRMDAIKTNGAMPLAKVNEPRGGEEQGPV